VSLVSLVNSQLGPRIGIAAGRLLPKGLAYRAAASIAHRVASGRGALPAAVAANQAVIRGLDPRDPSLPGAVEEVIHAAAIGYVDLFKAIAGGPTVLMAACSYDPQVKAWLDESAQEGRGVMAVSAHMSCFDMVLLSLASFGYFIQGLSYSDPRGSYLVQNTIRLHHGLEITPIDAPALRHALHRLKHAGLAMTAVDRPVPEGEPLQFFGRRALLPIGHARLAIMAGSKVLVAVCQSRGSGKYHIAAGGILDATSYAKRGDGPGRLAQDVLGILEPSIRARPEEWMMFHPVWPDEPAGADR
jgi:predicted LPLAT superfamily acyltransferase